MATLFDLLDKGYFPKELPPPFNTDRFAQVANANPKWLKPELEAKPRRPTHAVSHNLGRPGTLPRRLQIPNPIWQTALSALLADNWSDVEQQFDKSTLSRSRPTVRAKGAQAVVPSAHWRELAKLKAWVRASSRYIVRADISRFYESIYTHSIPWALHTKATAKAQRHKSSLLGNQLDSDVRLGQDSQTVGIPIGPDTSFILAEIILAAVDLEFGAQLPTVRTLRHYDDFEIGCRTRSDAEAVLGTLIELLSDYELAPNPAKTEIVELPYPISEPWVAPIGGFDFRKGEASAFVDFFDLAFEWARSRPRDSVLKYAVSRMWKVSIPRRTWPVVRDLLIQCALSRPETLRDVFTFIEGQVRLGHKVNKRQVRSLVNQVISEHGPSGHGSEVAWCLWLAVRFGVPIGQSATKVISGMDDSVVALLALDACSRGLVARNLDTTRWELHMSIDGLREEQWLLSYEANVKGWLPSVGGGDHVALDSTFGYLKSQDVSFYDATGFGPIPISTGWTDYY